MELIYNVIIFLGLYGGFRIFLRGLKYIRMNKEISELQTSYLSDCDFNESKKIKGYILPSKDHHIAPLSNKSCIAYIWYLEEETTGSRGSKYWSYVGTFCSQEGLILEDSSSGRSFLNPLFMNLEAWKNKTSACAIEWSGENKIISEMRSKYEFIKKTIEKSLLTDYKVTEYIIEEGKQYCFLGKLYPFENYRDWKTDKSKISRFGYGEEVSPSELDQIRTCIVPKGGGLSFGNYVSADDKALFSNMNEQEIRGYKSKKGKMLVVTAMVLIALGVSVLIYKLNLP